ncbi:galactose mutarotase-like [Saccoglossus kowalevskii]|uniref:Aldose 1-epimerase n=1 Tax=Saccoglossus kowalevskii TaxID=10224 RepID=A0ABM0GL89_SACKO|nr:PREDICTED: aldose 1-epimerase-like [Saccoglossus kowalevskii]
MSSPLVTTDIFGKTTNGDVVQRYTLKNKNGMVLQLIDLGATITSIQIPNKCAGSTDIVLGHATVKGYENDNYYFGEVVGRVCNRIHHGKFVLNGEEYNLPINNGPNHIHGGPNGFSRMIWDSAIDGDGIKFKYTSVDGEEGYPGELATHVTYQLTEDNEVIIHYIANTSKPTPVNLTNHCYFNLAGHDAVDIYDHLVMINADYYTPVDDIVIPTGEILPVEGSVFDLRTPVLLGDIIHKVPGGGYDNNYCLQSNKEKHLAARVHHPKSSRMMEVYTTQPGIQFYTANFLDGLACGKNGATYPKHSGLCLENQNYPNAINQPNFPNTVLNPGDVYDHTTWYKFSTLE